MRGDGDGWVRCSAGHRHWGRYGAAGLLLRDRTPGADPAGPAGRTAPVDRVVLQHRAWWSHQGGTWGLPGGARNSEETAVAAALRETAEEAGIEPAAVRPTGVLVDDHGGWSYSTVLGHPVAPTDPRPTGGESEDVRWVGADAVQRLPLHPGFAATWPRLRSAPALLLVVDAANVVGARGGGDGWWRDRAGATRRLLAALTPLVDGLPAAALPAAIGGGGSMCCCPASSWWSRAPPVRCWTTGTAGPVEPVGAPGSGDDTIVEVAAAAPVGYAALVVTADRGLRARLAKVGAAAVGPSWLLRLVDGPADGVADGPADGAVDGR